MSRFINSIFLSVVLFISLSALTSALVLKEFTCPHVDPIENFNVTAYGERVWYEIARYPNKVDREIKCVIYTIKRTSEGLETKYLTVPEKFAVSSKIKLAPENKGILILDLPYGSPVKSVQFHEQILAIDYERYYITYDCKYDEETKTWNEFSWVFSTSKNPDAEVRAAINEFIKSSKLLNASRYEWLELTDENCKPLFQ